MLMVIFMKQHLYLRKLEDFLVLLMVTMYIGRITQKHHWHIIRKVQYGIWKKEEKIIQNLKSRIRNMLMIYSRN